MGQQEDNELFNFIREFIWRTDRRTLRFSVKKRMAEAVMMLRFGEMDLLMSLFVLWNPRNFFPVSGNKLLSYS
jgi:hypothetical protein